MNKENQFLDVDSWGSGPWDGEPAMRHIEVFEYKGFQCRAGRGPLGSWNGYIELPVNHKWWKENKSEHYMALPLDVHGGVTFCEHRLPWQEVENDQTIWIGFDCSHSTDYIPRLEKINEFSNKGNPFYEAARKNRIEWEEEYPEFKRTYKTLEFVKNECRKMIDQINEKNNEVD